MNPPPEPPGRPSVRSRVERALADFLGARLDDRRDPAVRPALAEVRAFVLRGGKRLRPLLCYWGWRGGGGADCDEIVKVAAALEIFHAFCLIHDDIMDDSDTRRGRPTVHRALAARHAEARWRGDSGHFGTATAILLGDQCMAWADELLHDCGLDPRRLTTARRYYHRMRSELFYGQYLDLLEQALGPSTPDRSMTVVRYKSAKYTVERPLQLGGTLAGASPELLAAYSAYGVALGEAFQLRDDLLAAFGDPLLTGKSALNDFRHGKPTVLITQALRRASPSARTLINRLYGDPELDETGAERLREILVDTGARAAVESMIATRTHHARSTLATAPAEPTARQVLAELITQATDRTS